MKIGTGLLILTAGAMLLLGGCGHGDASGRQHEARLFGATYMTRNNPYFDVLNEGIEEVVEANGDILLTRDPLQDQEKQNEQIQEMIDEGIQMLFLNPVDWEKVQPALDACREAGVGIINVDTVVKDRDSVISIIETDNYQAGQLCALDMMAEIELVWVIQDVALGLLTIPNLIAMVALAPQVRKATKEYFGREAGGRG